MKNLQEATEKICELKGSLLVLDTLLMSLIQRYLKKPKKTSAPVPNTQRQVTSHQRKRMVTI